VNLQAGAQVQALTKLHSMADRGLFGFASSEERVPSKVKGTDFDAVGLVSEGYNDSHGAVEQQSVANSGAFCPVSQCCHKKPSREQVDAS
jgi:hypothetical protein